MFLMFRIVKRVFVTVMVLAVFVIGVPVVQIEWAGHRSDRAVTDAIVVFGAAQFDGEPSPVLKNRLDHALALYKIGIAPRVVTVGGSQPGDRFTEAAAGRNYLRSQGVPSSAVTAVKAGDDTLSSAAAVAEWGKAAGVREITVVSDRAHLARASAMMKSFGFDVRSSGPQTGPGSTMSSWYVARETAGLLHFWFVGERAVRGE